MVGSFASYLGFHKIAQTSQDQTDLELSFLVKYKHPKSLFSVPTAQGNLSEVSNFIAIFKLIFATDG